MVTTYTTNPSEAVPGQIVGAPITHFPHVMLCTQGEVYCGWSRVAKDPRDLVEVMAAKRRHEENCGGGLVVVGGR